MLSLVVQAGSHVVVAFCVVGMLLAQHLPPDLQGLLVKAQRLAMLSLVVQAGSDVVVAFGGGGMLLAQHLPSDLQRFSNENFRFLVTALAPEPSSPVIDPIALANHLLLLRRQLRQ